MTMRSTLACGVLGAFSCTALVAGCAAGESAHPTQPHTLATPSHAAAARAVAPAGDRSSASAPVHGQSPASSDAGQEAADIDATPPERFPGTRFPPERFEPPSVRSAKDGDGSWVPLGRAELHERAAQGPTALVRTTVHPHTVSKFITVTVAAIDLRNASLHWVAGRDDPGVDTFAESHPPGLVPSSDQDALLAVFNGGFKPQHGGWGMMAQGKVLVPPREEGCTIMMYPDDTVEIRSWPKVVARASEARAYRQTPPCLVEDGVVHPDLLAGNMKAWKGRAASRKTRRRTALGVDASGRILFFGVGVEADAKLLAEAMRAAGALHAAELDINWNWTRFLLFGTVDGELRVTSTLIPQMVHRTRGYVHHAQPRDFFYVKRRDAPR